jgi:hypothetical protein
VDQKSGPSFIPIAMPPFATCRICRNSMSQCCMEVCAGQKDYSHFEPRKDLNLSKMPQFPYEEFTNRMPSEVRLKVVAVYEREVVKAVKKLVEQIGVWLDDGDDLYR